MKAPRYFVVFTDGRESVGFNSIHQIERYLNTSVPDAIKAFIYEQSVSAVRNRWSMKPTKRSGNVTPKASSKQEGSPKRKIVKWTQRDLVNAVELWNKGATGAQIGKAINRSPRAVYAKLSKYSGNLLR